MSNPRPVGGRLISAAILFCSPAVLCVLLILKRLVLVSVL